METESISALGQVTPDRRATPPHHAAVQFRHASSSTRNTLRSGRAFHESKQNRKLINAPWLFYAHLSYYAVRPQLQVIIKELVKKQQNKRG